MGVDSEVKICEGQIAILIEVNGLEYIQEWFVEKHRTIHLIGNQLICYVLLTDGCGFRGSV